MINLKKASMQRIYEYAIRHMRKQKAPSFDTDNEVCLYRGPEGRACIVGAMFSDEELIAHGIEEGISLGPGEDAAILFEEMYGDDKTALLQRLQECHDSPAHITVASPENLERYMEQVEENFQKVAREFNLKYPAPGERLRA